MYSLLIFLLHKNMNFRCDVPIVKGIIIKLLLVIVIIYGFCDVYNIFRIILCTFLFYLYQYNYDTFTAVSLTNCCSFSLKYVGTIMTNFMSVSRIFKRSQLIERVKSARRKPNARSKIVVDSISFPVISLCIVC